MSLMESMRSGTDSTAMQLIFAAVVVSFIGWGVGMNGNSTATVATVNGEPITSLELAQVYQNAERQQSAATRKALSEDDRQELKERVVEEMIRQRALLQEAHRLGLEVSAAEIAEQLYTMPFLLDEDGQFDKQAFQNFLRRMGTTRANFEAEVRDELLVAKLRGLMALGASVSEPMVERRYVDDNTRLDLSFVRMRPADFRDSIQPTPDQVAAYVAEHPDAIKARYDDDFTRLYDIPERVSVTLLRLSLRDDGLGLSELKTRMDGLLAKISGGADMGDLARVWSEDASAASDGLVTDLVVDELATPIKDALAKLSPGELSSVIVGDRDVRLYRLEARKPRETTELASVQDEIATRLLQEEEAPVRMAAFAEQELLPAWTAADAPPTALLEPYGLVVSQTGPQPASGFTGMLKPPADMIKAARGADVGQVLPEVYQEGDVVWVGALSAREDADMADFAEHKDEERERALLIRRSEFYGAWADDVVARAVVKRM